MPPLFIWRDRSKIQKTWDYQEGGMPFQIVRGLSDVYNGLMNSCPFCKTNYETKVIRDSTLPIQERTSICPKCGFNFKLFNFTVITKDSLDNACGNEDLDVAVLKKFDIKDCKAGLSELDSRLKKRTGGISSLNVETFKEIAADVYSNTGFDVRWIRRSVDSEYDLTLLEDNSGRQIIISCKRCPSENKVEIGIIESVLGVESGAGVQNVKIVAASRFMKDGIEGMETIHYALELEHAEELIKQLGLLKNSLTVI